MHVFTQEVALLPCIWILYLTSSKLFALVLSLPYLFLTNHHQGKILKPDVVSSVSL